LAVVHALRESLLALIRFRMLVVVARILAVGVLLVAVWFIGARVRALLATAPAVTAGVPGQAAPRGPLAAYRHRRDRRQTRVYD